MKPDLVHEKSTERHARERRFAAPANYIEMHTPCTQALFTGHCIPHAPQLKKSVCVSTQVSPHCTSPDSLHAWHCPEMHIRCVEGHGAQLPQC